MTETLARQQSENFIYFKVVRLTLNSKLYTIKQYIYITNLLLSDKTVLCSSGYNSTASSCLAI